MELRGAVETWLRENEEKREDQSYLLRPGKLNQLKAVRQKTLSSRGKGEALMATLTLLAAEGIATLQRTPGRGGRKGKWEEGEVGTVDRGLSGVDGGGGMDLGGRKRRAGEEGETDSERVRDKRRTGATSVEPGGGMEVDSQSSTEALPNSESDRSR